MNNKHKGKGCIPVLSFFTGAGFLDIGFIQAGFDIIWRNENNLSYVKGFEYGMSSLTGGPNHSRVENTNTIVEVDSKQIASQAFHNTSKPAIFGIIGGPPCPDFSVGGKNRGAKGNLGQLSQIYVDRILELEPTFFLFENVLGMLKTYKHRLFLNSLKEQLRKKYAISLRVLNALEYGVPQDRERVIFIGFRKQWLKKEYKIEIPPYSESWFPWPRDRRYEDAKNRFRWPTSSPFGGNPPKPEGLPEKLMVGPLICNIEEIAKLPNGLEGFRPKSDKFYKIPEGDDSRKSFKRLHRWRFSPTAAYGNNEVHLHPTEPRRITVREAMRIQTVPDAYALPPEMPLSHKFKTIGNGVPVKLAKVIAVTILHVLNGEWNGDTSPNYNYEEYPLFAEDVNFLTEANGKCQ